MGCIYQQSCGGCSFRDKTPEEYQTFKEQKVKGILNAGLQEHTYHWNKPVFLPFNNLMTSYCIGLMSWNSSIKIY